MAEVERDSFLDAFGEEVRKGDAVAYVLGDRHSKRIVKGVVEKIGYNRDRTFGRTRYYIRLDNDPQYPNDVVGRLSPMEETKRIMKI